MLDKIKKYFKKEIRLDNEMVAFVDGELLPLEKVKDPVFSSKVLGEGIAIKPTNNLIVAPFDCKISSIFPTKHAIGLTTEKGYEFLLHIGIDTVALKGNGFETYVKVGDNVSLGQPLLRFNKKYLSDKNLDLTTMLFLTKPKNEIRITGKKNVKKGNDIVACIKEGE